MKVRKKPVEVDAWKISDLLNLHMGDLPQKVLAAYNDGLIDFESDRISIATMEGIMTGWGSWFLICGVEGEFYPCDGEIFHKSYDIVVQGTAQPLLGVPTPYDANPEG